MKTVCHSDGQLISYPEVTPGINRWVYSDEKPPEETVLITANGLRRLLRIASAAWPFVMTKMLSESNDDGAAPVKAMYDKETSPEKTTELMNELSSIWCEGDMVMSRLFVDKDGAAIAHKDSEVDEASIPPWER